MQVIKTKFSGLLLYHRNSFKDNRGFFRELFVEKDLKKKFIFDYYSLSKNNVIRGLHLQLKKPQGKLITVLSGKIFDVALDCRKKSKTFGKFFTICLSEKNNTSLYIPPGFAHGFCSLSKRSLLHYKCTNYQNIKSETGILWNDIDLKINWPNKKNYLISNKDKNNYTFRYLINSKQFKKIKW